MNNKQKIKAYTEQFLAKLPTRPPFVKRREVIEEFLANLPEFKDSTDEAILKVIDERDAAEEALGSVYEIVTGVSVEWSNVFGYQQAIEEIEEKVDALKAKKWQKWICCSEKMPPRNEEFLIFWYDQTDSKRRVKPQYSNTFTIHSGRSANDFYWCKASTPETPFEEHPCIKELRKKQDGYDPRTIEYQGIESVIKIVTPHLEKFKQYEGKE